MLLHFLHTNKKNKNEEMHFFKTFLVNSWRPSQSAALTVVSVSEWELRAGLVAKWLGDLVLTCSGLQLLSGGLSPHG